MKIADLKKELDKDMKLNMESLHEDAVNIPMLYSKWLQFSLDEQAKAIRLKSKLKTLRLERWHYYLGKGLAVDYKMEPLGHKVMKTDVQRYIDADEKIRKLEDRYELQMALVDFLEKAVRGISNRSFGIQNAIAFLKYQNGLV